jgi:N-formylglutamate deformylase
VSTIRFKVHIDVIEAHEPRIPVVVEVPHAGTAVDPSSMPWIVAPVRSLGRDADLYVDQLFQDAPSLGATLVVARLSRYVCDLNRDVGDIDAESVQDFTGPSYPHGLIWRRSTDGHSVLPRPLPQHELQRRLDEVYYPYHQALQRLLNMRRDEFGYAVLVCAHSMPSRGRAGHVDVGQARADIVPGTRGRTTATPALIDATEAVARQLGWTVAHDDPYRGGFTVGQYGRPEQGWHAVQIELSRALYLDESSLVPSVGFKKVREFCRLLVARLGSTTVPTWQAPGEDLAVDSTPPCLARR